LGLTLGQVAMDEKTNEITAIPTLLEGLLLEGWVVTIDALLTQQKSAQAIVDAGADSLMIVKENQPTLREEIAPAFADPALLAGTNTAAAESRGNGRLEQRTLTLTTALADGRASGKSSNWCAPGPTCRPAKSPAKRSTAFPACLLPGPTPPFVLDRIRSHWISENGSHYLRDVTFAEDHRAHREHSPGDGRRA
jgi:predicted transposase YbfD/YdcC